MKLLFGLAATLLGGAAFLAAFFLALTRIENQTERTGHDLTALIHKKHLALEHTETLLGQAKHILAQTPLLPPEKPLLGHQTIQVPGTGQAGIFWPRHQDDNDTPDPWPFAFLKAAPLVIETLIPKNSPLASMRFFSESFTVRYPKETSAGFRQTGTYDFFKQLLSLGSGWMVHQTDGTPPTLQHLSTFSNDDGRGGIFVLETGKHFLKRFFDGAYRPYGALLLYDKNNNILAYEATELPGQERPKALSDLLPPHTLQKVMTAKPGQFAWISYPPFSWRGITKVPLRNAGITALYIASPLEALWAQRFFLFWMTAFFLVGGGLLLLAFWFLIQRRIFGPLATLLSHLNQQRLGQELDGTPSLPSVWNDITQSITATFAETRGQKQALTEQVDALHKQTALLQKQLYAEKKNTADAQSLETFATGALGLLQTIKAHLKNTNAGDKNLVNAIEALQTNAFQAEEEQTICLAKIVQAQAKTAASLTGDLWTNVPPPTITFRGFEDTHVVFTRPAQLGAALLLFFLGLFKDMGVQKAQTRHKPKTCALHLRKDAKEGLLVVSVHTNTPAPHSMDHVLHGLSRAAAWFGGSLEQISGKHAHFVLKAPLLTSAAIANPGR